MHGLSKWRIAKRVGVSWQTVNFWDRKIFKPSSKNKERLRGLLETVQKEVKVNEI